MTPLYGYLICRLAYGKIPEMILPTSISALLGITNRIAKQQEVQKHRHLTVHHTHTYKMYQ